MLDVTNAVSLGTTVGAWAFGIGSVWWARKAAKFSEPTGNGWTKGLGARLDKQDACLARLEAAQTLHLRDHAFGHLPHDKD